MRKQSETFGEIGRDSTFVHVARFFESVRQHQPAVEDGVMGHHAAGAAHMINVSLRQRRPLEWNFATDALAPA